MPLRNCFKFLVGRMLLGLCFKKENRFRGMLQTSDICLKIIQSRGEADEGRLARCHNYYRWRWVQGGHWTILSTIKKTLSVLLILIC